MWKLIKTLLLIFVSIWPRLVAWYNPAEIPCDIPLLDVVDPWNSTREEIAIADLRTRISDIVATDWKFKDEYYLLLWLTVENLDPEATETRIREAVKWRAEYGLNNWTSITYPKEFDQELETFYTTNTKTGIPLVVCNGGKYDLSSILDKFGSEAFMLYWAKLYSRLEEEVIAYNRRENQDTTQITSDCVKGAVSITNALDFSLWQLSDSQVVSTCKDMLTNFMAHFPGLFRNALIVNMNFAFRAAMGLVKPIVMVPYLTIEDYGTDPEEWRSRVEEIIDLKYLPPHLQA